MHVGQRGRLDIRPADAAETVFGADNHRFVLDIQAVADGVDAVDEFKRETVEHGRGLIEMDEVEIRRQLDAQGFGEIGKNVGQDGFRRVEIVGDLRFARHVRARKVEFGRAVEAALLHLFQQGVRLVGRHADQRQEKRPPGHFVLQFEQIVQIVVYALVRQPHRVDAAQRHIPIARLGIARPKIQSRGFGYEAPRRRVPDLFQLGDGHTGYACGIHQAVVEMKPCDLRLC